jgi:hypothetical protein
MRPPRGSGPDLAEPPARHDGEGDGRLRHTNRADSPSAAAYCHAMKAASLSVLALALAATACGDDDSGTGGSSPTNSGTSTGSSTATGAGSPASTGAGEGGAGTGGAGTGGASTGGGGAGTGGSLPTVEDPCAEWESVFPDGAVDVTPDQRGELQALLDEHGTIRLTPGGDYRTGGPEVVRLGDDQAILSLGGSRFPDVLVGAGTEGAKVRGLQAAHIRFEPGEVSRSNCFMSLKGSGIVVEGASVERNGFVDFGQTALDVDTSAGGYFRDNRLIKINSHGDEFVVRLIGDASRTSGGNVFLLTDSQTAGGAPFLVDGQSDVTFVGVNAEAFNWNELSSEPYLFRVTDTGTFRGAYFVGTSRHGAATYPMLDLDAEAIHLHRTGSGLEAPQVRLGESVDTLVSWENGWQDAADIDDRASGGVRFHAFEAQGAAAVRLGDEELTAPPAEEADEAAVRDLFTEHRAGAPWTLPSFPEIPDPTGPDWLANSAGQPDDRAAIQALLDAPDGTAVLEARTYYLAGPLVMGAGDRIIGAGMGRTAIVALDPSIDLIRVEWGDPSGCQAMTAGFMVAELTLQGGASGIESSFPGMQVNQAVLSHVAFRDMSVAGLHISGTYGWDNNFFDHLAFVDCAFGVLQEGQPRPDDSCYAIGEWSTMSYMDKTIFYRNQFVRCGQGAALRPTRANHLDGFVESRFAGGGPAIEMNFANTGTMIASCVFEDNDADPVVSGPSPLVNCSFVADRGTSMVGPGADVEGSTFRGGTSDSATIFGNIPPSDWRYTMFVNVANSDSDIPIGAVAETLPIGGLYVNNVVPDEEPFSAFMTALDYRTEGTPPSDDDSREIYTILTGPTSAGSQLLFRRAD